eukprot:gene42136-biopygen6681
MEGKSWKATEGLLERAARQGGVTVGMYGRQITGKYFGKDQQIYRNLIEWLAEDGKYLTKATRAHTNLDSELNSYMNLHADERDRLTQWGIVKLADFYMVNKAGHPEWNIPAALKLERLLHQCPTISTIDKGYSIQQGQLWERDGTRDNCGAYDPKNTMTHYVYHDEATQLSRDAWDHKNARVICLAGYLNDPLDDTKANCRFIKHERRLRVEALRDIQQHEELLLAYGDDYWINNDFSLDILQQAMVAYVTGSTRAAWHTKIQQASATLTIQSVDAMNGKLLALSPTLGTVPSATAPTVWGISNSGLRQRCEERQKKQKQSRDEETNPVAQVLLNVYTGNCSSTDYLQASAGEVRLTDQVNSSTREKGRTGVLRQYRPL